MGLWESEVLPHLVDWGMNTGSMRRERQRALAAAKGHVLEVGFGSGLNLQHYPAGVTALTAVEPSARAVTLAETRIADAPFPVEVIGLDGAEIPCADESFDTVVSTFTLCTIPRVSDALGQLRRVLRPGGRFIFLEHGRSPDRHVHRVQRLANPVQKTLFGGCHLTRDIPRLVQDAGFSVLTIDRYYGKGIKPMVYFFRGEAYKESK